MGRVPPWKRPGGQVRPHPDQGRIIKEARTKAGIGLRKLAGVVGISPGYLCHLEANRRALSPRTAKRLHDALGVDVPLVVIDPVQTAAGRREARERRGERIAQLQREVAELEDAARMTRTIWPRFTFSRRF